MERPLSLRGTTLHRNALEKEGHAAYTPLRALIVEDSEDDTLLIAHELRRGGYDLTVKRVDTRQAMGAALADQSWDIVISDYAIPGFGGLEALELLQARGLDLPFILISGTMGEDIAVSAMKAGAHDYLMKDNLARLVPAVARELQEAKVRRARRQAEQALEQRAKELEQEIAQRVEAEKERERLLEEIREQAQRIQRIVDTVPEGVLLVDEENRITLANPAGQRDLELLTSARVGEVLESLGERPLVEFLTWPEDPSWHEIGAGGHTFEVIARPTQAASEPSQWVLVIRDMTYERTVQERARQQDRLAAIGGLAGGVAHDFNNLLTAIQGYTQFVLDGLAPDNPIRADLQEVQKAADRATALTNQLLIFSRKQVLQPVVLDLNTVIADIEEMLRRLIGEDIVLNTSLSPSLGRAMADPGQIGQVIMNLSINARDAMPQGGRLFLETRNVVLDETYAQKHPDIAPGAYVLLSVSDTGVGMSKEVRAHVFEPFFTTKEEGRGTGLGLSTVHGIVTQSGGHVEVYSELEAGTTFKIYLPRVQARAEPAPRAQPAQTFLPFIFTPRTPLGTSMEQGSGASQPSSARGTMLGAGLCAMRGLDRAMETATYAMNSFIASSFRLSRLSSVSLFFSMIIMAANPPPIIMGTSTRLIMKLLVLTAARYSRLNRVQILFIAGLLSFRSCNPDKYIVKRWFGNFEFADPGKFQQIG